MLDSTLTYKNDFLQGMSKLYSIKQVQSFTGIKEHTIRIWEKRYSVVVPQRLEGKMRSYNLDEVQTIMEMALLNQTGEKISNIVKLGSEERQSKIKLLYTEHGIQQRTIHELFLCMFRLDIDRFENVLDKYAAAYDIHLLIQDIIIPFIERLGLLSYRKNTSEIHFIVTAIRKKIHSGIENIKTNYLMNNCKTALLFLPINEYFDLILLYTAYLLKRNGWQVWYLGTHISMDNLLSVLRIKKPTILLTYKHGKQKMNLDSYTFYLQPYLNPLPLYIAVADKLLESESENQFYFTELIDGIMSKF